VHSGLADEKICFRDNRAFGLLVRLCSYTRFDVERGDEALCVFVELMAAPLQSHSDAVLAEAAAAASDVDARRRLREQWPSDVRALSARALALIGNAAVEARRSLLLPLVALAARTVARDDNAAVVSAAAASLLTLLDAVEADDDNDDDKEARTTLLYKQVGAVVRGSIEGDGELETALLAARIDALLALSGKRRDEATMRSIGTRLARTDSSADEHAALVTLLQTRLTPTLVDEYGRSVLPPLVAACARHAADERGDAAVTGIVKLLLLVHAQLEARGEPLLSGVVVPLLAACIAASSTSSSRAAPARYTLCVQVAMRLANASPSGFRAGVEALPAEAAAALRTGMQLALADERAAQQRAAAAEAQRQAALASKQAARDRLLAEQRAAAKKKLDLTNF
jgi:predicted RecA/RadA family phage recombinase